jgi:acetylornithine deacetylase
MALQHDKVVERIVPDEVLALEQKVVRIPSPSGKEQELAEFLAGQMEAMGLEVQMYDVEIPARLGGGATQQPLGRLRGRHGTPVLMFNGHMDHNPLLGTWDRDPFSGDFIDGWVHGRGAMDEKGGLVAALAAVQALVRAGATLNGDVLVAPVALHKHDGLGSRFLLEQGIRPSYCINTENTGNEIITACVGLVRTRISTYNQPIHFHAIEPLRERFYNPIEQMGAVIQVLAPSHTVPEWLQFEPSEALPGFPQGGFIDFHSHYRKDGWCHLDYQVRTVPGVTREGVERDLGALLNMLKSDRPKMHVKLEWDPMDVPPMVTPYDSPIVEALREAYEQVTHTPAVTGSRGRLGSVGDGQLFAAAGVPSVLFGPGTSEIFEQWPTPNEKILLEDILVSARVMALAAMKLCA